MKHLLGWLRKRAVIVVIILAAMLLEAISAFQYSYTRDLLEKELEKSCFYGLTSAALRIQEVTSEVEVMVANQMWHVKRHLHEPDYMGELAANMVKQGGFNILGGGAAFKPNYYPSKGYYFEPYAHKTKDSVVITQVGSEIHDYTKSSFYQAAMRGDTTKWTSPYLDKEGARGVVITYALPILDENDTSVGALLVDLATDWISEVVNERHTYTSSFVLVLSESGELIASPSDTLADPALVRKIVEMMNDSTVVREKKENGYITGFAFEDDDGEKGHVYYGLKRYEPHWQMVVVCYDKEVFGKLEQMRKRIMWMALFGLAVLGLIIQLFVTSHRRLQKAQVTQERINGELRIANRIQQSMLPPNHRHRKDVDICGSLVPAREVGGDIFDYYIRDEKLFFCIGDVSGKGTAAAMLMGVIHSMFRSFSLRENNPTRIMQSINELSCEGNDSNMFVTFFLGVLDLPTGRLRYCDAGHDSPYIIHNSEIFRLDCIAHLPVGVLDDMKYTTQEIQLQPDSTIFLYTDGLTEAMDQEHKQFGLDRVEKILSTLTDENPEKVLQKVTEAMHEFVKDAEQSDDLTMLAVHYTPQSFGSTLTETLVLKNDIHEVSKLSSFMKSVTEKINLEASLSRQLRLAVEEAVVNVIDYAYPNEKNGEVEVCMMFNGQSLKIIITDSGVPFDPTAKEKADTTLSAEDRQIGGLGILLVRELMDSINYEREEGKNILTLTKTIHNS